MGGNDDFNYELSAEEDDLEYESESELSEELEYEYIGDEQQIAESADQHVLPYRILSFEQIEALLNSLIHRTAEITGLKPALAYLLLDAYDWDVSECASASLDPGDSAAKLSDLKPNSVKKRSKTTECLVCLEKIEHPYSLECGHALCRDCFRQYVKINVFDNRKLFSTTCPGNAKCNRQVHRDHIVDLLPDYVKQYDNLATKAFISKRPQKFRSCPAPQCEYIAMRAEHNEVDMNSGTLCLCGTTYCFSCGLACDHYAVPCGLASHWSAIADKEHRSSLWISENTKKCPKCLTTIERHEGCNHMQCEQCKHEFCWLCHRDWAEHSGNSYYECSSLSQTLPPKKKDKEVGAEKSSKKQLDRLWHYMEEFDKHTVLASRHLTDNRHSHDAHNLLAWTYALLYITTNTNAKIILEELAEAMARDSLADSPHVQQRAKASADFMTDGETKWVIDASSRTRLDREVSQKLMKDK